MYCMDYGSGDHYTAYRDCVWQQCSESACEHGLRSGLNISPCYWRTAPLDHSRWRSTHAGLNEEETRVIVMCCNVECRRCRIVCVTSSASETINGSVVVTIDNQTAVAAAVTFVYKVRKLFPSSSLSSLLLLLVVSLLMLFCRKSNFIRYKLFYILFLF